MQSAHCFGKNEIFTQARATKYKLCNFSDAGYESNAPIFAFETNTAHYKLEQ